MFHHVSKFEKRVADFFNAPYAIAIDSCTHGLELCLRLQSTQVITVPSRTYISIPFLAIKLNIEWSWDRKSWEDYYFLGHTNIIDAAVYWKQGGYIPGTYMCISFQHKKHLSLGRGGVILCDNVKNYKILKKMSYDGRIPEIPWREQNIDQIGYHYYMTPETAIEGLSKIENAINTKPKKWQWEEWPDLTQMKIFQ
tara:strand:+ start:40 stop:627 length:588 start_codon:yes stop_codon:yes gene_type:complete